jgi:hypothetical protein
MRQQVRQNDVERVQHANTFTAVAVVVPLRGGLLMVRHALLGESCGKLALPGGYQMLGRLGRKLGAGGAGRHEHCGRPCHTSNRGGGNYPGSTAQSALLPEPAIEHEGAFVYVAEVSKVLINHEPVETALLLHTRMVSQFSAPSNPI